MKKIISHLLLVSLALLVAAPAWAESLRDVIATLEVPFQAGTPSNDAVHDIETVFNQRVTIASLEETQSGSGEVKLMFDYTDPNTVPMVSFSFKYETPPRNEFVSDGRTLWVYTPDTNQVIESDIREVSEARPENPLTFLTGLGNLSRDFSVRWGSPDNYDADGNYIIDLVPRTSTVIVTKLTLVVDRRAVREFMRGTTGRTFPIRESIAVEPNGNLNHIIFDQQNMRLNRGLSPGEFRYSPPPGAEVVRPRGNQMGY